jgi:hypothetical protein
MTLAKKIRKLARDVDNSTTRLRCLQRPIRSRPTRG